MKAATRMGARIVLQTCAALLTLLPFISISSIILSYTQCTQVEGAIFQLHSGVLGLLISCLEAEILPFKDILSIVFEL